MEQTHYNLLLRWFLDLSIVDAVWNHSTFSKNHDRLLEHEAVPALFAEVVRLAESRGLLSKGLRLEPDANAQYPGRERLMKPSSSMGNGESEALASKRVAAVSERARLAGRISSHRCFSTTC